MKRVLLLVIMGLLFSSCLMGWDAYRETVKKPYLPKEQNIDFMVYLSETDMYIWQYSYYEKYSKSVEKGVFYLISPNERYRIAIENQEYTLKIKVIYDGFNKKSYSYPSFLFLGIKNNYPIIDESKLNKDNSRRI